MVKTALLKEAEDLLKLDDENFAKSVLRISDKKLAELSAVESLVKRTRTLIDEKGDDLERWRKEVAAEPKQPEGE